jgi:hypothetical protein
MSPRLSSIIMNVCSTINGLSAVPLLCKGKGRRITCYMRHIVQGGSNMTGTDFLLNHNCQTL